MATAGSIVVDLLMRTGAFETDAARAEKRVKQLQKQIDSFAKSVGTAVGVGVAAATTALAALTYQSIQYADQLDELSARLGISTEQLSAWGYAAKLSGTSLDSLASAIPKLSKNMAAALDQNSRMGQLFETLGISVTDAAGNLRDVESVLPEIADRFKALDNDTTEAALAMELFGKSGAELLEFLNRGASGLDDFAQRAAELGIVVGEDTAAAAAEFNDKLDEMKGLATGLGLQIAEKLLPTMIDLVDRFRDLIQEGGLAEKIVAGIQFVVDDVTGSFERLGQLIQDVTDFFGGLTDGAKASYEVLAGIASLDWGRIKAGMEAGAAADDRVMSGLFGGGRNKGPNTAGKANPDYLGLPGYMTGQTSNFSAVPFSAVDFSAKVDEGRLGRFFSGADRGGGKAKARREEAKATKELTDAEKDLLAIEELWNEAATENVIKQGERVLATHQAQEAIAAQIADMEFELALMSMGRVEREKEIALRYAGAEATDEQRAAIGRLVEAMERERELVGFMDGFRSDAAGALKSLAMDFDNAGQHIMDFFDSIAERITQMIAERWIEQLFGAQGSTGAGTGGGDFLGSLFGMVFGGGRAGGGDTMPGNAYLVGENGPEMFVPRTAGTVLNADTTAGFRGGSGRAFKQTVNVVVSGRPDRSTPEQIARASGREAARAMSRTGR